MSGGAQADTATNGSASLVRTLVQGGVGICFANPGTSEMHFVSSLDRIDGILYGDGPSQGFIKERVFAHPGLRITFTGLVYDQTDAVASESYGVAWRSQTVPEPRAILLVAVTGLALLARTRFRRSRADAKNSFS